MDDNKTLTLINGDRIAMSKYMSLVFEVQDLAVASPATVSRAGMVYLDVDDLGYRPFVDSWLNSTFTTAEDRDLVASVGPHCTLCVYLVCVYPIASLSAAV